MSLFEKRPPPTRSDLVADALEGAYENASDENRMWYWLGYAAGVTDEEDLLQEEQ